MLMTGKRSVIERQPRERAGRALGPTKLNGRDSRLGARSSGGTWSLVRVHAGDFLRRELDPRSQIRKSLSKWLQRPFGRKTPAIDGG
jgi:hypothetical protein